MGLVNLPVGICQAVDKAKDVTFTQAGPNGEELRQAYLTPDGQEVPKDDIQKGIREAGEFFPISAEALEQINEATKLPNLDVIDVIERATFEAESARACEMYYVQNHPKNGNASAFKLFVDTLEETGKALVSKWTARSRQKLVVLYPQNGILMASALVFAGDVREPDEAVRAHQDGSYTDAEKQMAVQLIEQLATSDTNALEMERDEALQMKRKLVEDARQGKAIEVPETQDAPQVSGLAAALEASLAAAKEPVNA
jgi:Ku protein